MAALCVTLDSTVVVSCTRTDDVIQSVVSRSITRPPVGGNISHSRSRRRADADVHTHIHERESVRNSTDDHDSARHINRSVNSTHGHEIRAHINQSATRRTAANPN